MLDYAQYLTWSDWLPLEGCWLGRLVPQQPGLYRIRRVGCTDWTTSARLGLAV